MLLVTQSKASGMPYAPSRQYLGKMAKEKDRPAFFVDDGDKVKINIEHPEWEALLEKRRKEKPDRIVQTKGTGKPKGSRGGGKSKSEKKPAKPKGDRASAKSVSLPAAKDGASLGLSSKELHELVQKSQIATLEEQIIKNDISRAKAEQEKMKLKRQAGELIERRLAEFLYFGHIEKLYIEILTLTKKLEPIIDNLVKERDTRGVVKRLDRELQNILAEVRKAQEKDLEEWEEERGKQ
jgi:hypothetical protein